MTAKTERSQLGDLLVEMGLVDREQLAIALSHQRANGGRLGRILAERKLVDEDRLAKAIAARLGLEAVNLSSLKIHERVLALIPGGTALKYGALPIAIKRTNQAEFVYVVMADPLDSEALAELARVSGREIRVLVATATELDRALEQHYRPTAVRPPATEALPKSAPLVVAPIPAQAAPAQKTDPAAAAAQKRGLPPPSATGPVPTQQTKPRAPQPQVASAAAQASVQAPGSSPPLAPRMELPRAKTAGNPLPPSPIPPPPVVTTSRPPIASDKKAMLPPLPDRRPGPPSLPQGVQGDLRGQSAAHAQGGAPLPGDARGQSVAHSPGDARGQGGLSDPRGQAGAHSQAELRGQDLRGDGRAQEARGGGSYSPGEQRAQGDVRGQGGAWQAGGRGQADAHGVRGMGDLHLQGDRGPGVHSQGDRGQGVHPQSDRGQGVHPQGDRGPGGVHPQGDRGPGGVHPQGDRGPGVHPQGDRGQAGLHAQSDRGPGVHPPERGPGGVHPQGDRAQAAHSQSGSHPPQRPEPSRSTQTPLPPQPGPPRSSPPFPAQTAQRPPPPLSDPLAKTTPRSTPSQGTALPPLRRDATGRDMQQELFGDRKTPMPLQAPRVPTADEDKTGLDLALDGPVLLDGLRAVAGDSGDVENTLGEWDRAVRDWPRHVSSPSVSSTQTLPPENSPLRSQLAEPVSPQPVIESPHGSLVIEPVTTESSLKDLGLKSSEIPRAIASDVPTSIPRPQVVEEVQVEILEIAEGVDDIKTSQVELTEDYEMLILRGVMPDPGEGVAARAEKPKDPSKRRDRDPFALEIPVDISDAPNPFDGPENIDIPVGLERTGIIPAIDWENEEFVPPPLSSQAAEPLLAGSDDIPTSSAVARARSESFEPADSPPRSNDELTVDPLHRPEPRFDTLLEARAAAQEIEEAPRKRRSDPPAPIDLVDEVEDHELRDHAHQVDRDDDDDDDATHDDRLDNHLLDHLDERPELAPSDDSDSSEMPVIEPSSLVSLMDDDGTSKVEDTGADQAPILHADSNGAMLRPQLPTPPPTPAPAPTLLFDEKDREMSPVKSARLPKEPGEEETNPRIDGNSVRAALSGSTLVDEPLSLEKIEDPTPPRDMVDRGDRALALKDRDRVLDDLEGMFIAQPPKHETPRPQPPSNAPDETAGMVEALAANDSLNSAERAQLVLAIGRLLLEKGVITKDELAAELKK